MKRYYGVFEILKNEYPRKITEFPLYYKEAADLYDLTQDVYDDYEMFQEQAFMQGGPILELCCGSGRITLPLARAGFQITAVDLSEDMLANLEAALKRKYRRVQGNVTCIQGDMTKLDLHKTYNLIIIAATSIRLMENDFIEFFNQMYQLLEEGGCLYFNFEDIPVSSNENFIEEPLAAGLFEDKSGNLSIINTQRFISYKEKRAVVNMFGYKPGIDDKVLLSYTDYRVFGCKDIKEAAQKSLFGSCEIVPHIGQNYFCKMIKK